MKDGNLTYISLQGLNRSKNMSSKVTPGINPQAKLSHFSKEETKIVLKFSGEWYITNGGGTFTLGRKSDYKYFLMKPTENYKELFNIEQEIIVIFSDYDSFEPRSLDAIEEVEKMYQALRLERLCCVMISNDNNIVERMHELVLKDQESKIVVPFSYSEILNQHDSYQIRNRFKRHFYNRDLFAFESALQKDLYFFGRHELVMKLANRHKSNENTALFGLRKTGKTSVIYGVQRALNTLGDFSVFIDCQNPGFHKRRWSKALWFILREVQTSLGLSLAIADEEKFTDQDASLLFEDGMRKLHKLLKGQSVLLIFDEVENITAKTSPSDHWTKDLDFVFFWQTLRTIFQKKGNLYTYFIVGTNPSCIEIDKINGIANPIFNQIYFEYIPNFDVPQTRDMVRKLGRIMGLHFDEIIYAKLTEDFGGHPFLIRHVCSIINKHAKEERPVRIDKLDYEKAKRQFQSEYSSYIDMIVGVLRDFYPSEFDMLKYIALDDMATFNEFAGMSHEFTNHLLGYKIIDKNNSNYSFKIDAIREFLLSKHRYERVLDNVPERLKEISERRNNFELKLRKLVRIQMQGQLGKAEATKKYLEILGEPRKSNYAGRDFGDLFDANKAEIYFEDLRKAIVKNYDQFKHILGRNKDDVNSKLEMVNKYRADAHAKAVSKEEMDVFRVSITYLEDKIAEVFE